MNTFIAACRTKNFYDTVKKCANLLLPHLSNVVFLSCVTYVVDEHDINIYIYVSSLIKYLSAS